MSAYPECMVCKCDISNKVQHIGNDGMMYCDDHFQRPVESDTEKELREQLRRALIVIAAAEKFCNVPFEHLPLVEELELAEAVSAWRAYEDIVASEK